MSLLISNVSVPVLPHVADGRDSLVIWRAGQFILNRFVEGSQ